MTDIFDPLNCTIAFNNCRTNEQIQVFLWQQINKIQTFLNDFNGNQNLYNQDNTAKVTNNTNAIANINNEINALKTLSNNLSTQFTQLNADNNAFKLHVDETLRLYQDSINKIASNVDKLTIDGQALQQRVGILESQTDLNKLQQIIKSYEDIKNDFSNQLKEQSEQLKKIITENINAVNQAFNEYKASVNKTIADINDTVQHSNENVNNLNVITTQIEKDLEDFKKKTENDLIENSVSDNEYTDEKISDLRDEFHREIEALHTQLQNNINKLTTDSDTKFIALNKRLDDFTAHFDEIIKEQLEKYESVLDIATKLEAKSKEFEKQVNNAVKLSVQANDNAKDLILLYNEGTKKYDAHFIKYDYYLKRLNESLRYINSSIVRDFITDEGLYNIKIALLEAKDGTFTFTSKYYTFITVDNKGAKQLVKNLKVSTDAIKYDEYKVIADDSYDEYRLILRAYNVGGTVKYCVDVKHIDNEFNQIEFAIEKIIREKDKDYNDIVDTNIHKIPEPVEPKEPECDAMKVVIVNPDDCSPCKPKPPKPLPQTPLDVLDKLPTETYAEYMCRLSAWALKLKEINDVTPIPDSCSIVGGETKPVFPPPQDGKDGKDGVGIKDIEISVHEKEQVDIVKEKDKE